MKDVVYAPKYWKQAKRKKALLLCSAVLEQHYEQTPLQCHKQITQTSGTILRRRLELNNHLNDIQSQPITASTQQNSRC